MSLELSFGATGWGCIFYLGVVKLLFEKFNKEQLKNIKIAASSSGNIAAIILLFNVDIFCNRFI